MDIFRRFNSRSIEDRTVDTLIGLSKGLLADGRLVQAEVEFLYQWLIQNKGTKNPVLLSLEAKLEDILADGIVDEEEARELFAILKAFNGEEAEFGEIAKPSTLPLCSPVPIVTFPEKHFILTGTFAFGTRQQCTELITSLGGFLAKSVNKNVDYLVIGSYVSDSWAHESFGRKIEKAVEYRDTGIAKLSIINEESWLESANVL